MPEKGHVLITGGSSGIGEALVRAFAEEGYKVSFTFLRGSDRAQTLVKELAAHQVSSHQFDLANPGALERLAGEFPTGVDVLIHNAGVGTKTVEDYAQTSEDEELLFFRVNALAPMHLTKHLLPRMRAKGRGKIIFISSVDGGIEAFPGARYADGMSKAAVTHFAKQLSAELATDTIDVYTICPGATDTPMFRSSTLNHLSEKERESLCAQLPGRRLVSPGDIAEVALFLCRQGAGSVLRGSIIDASLGLGSWPAAIPRDR